MDRKKGLLNVSVSLFSRVLLLAAALLVRRLLVTDTQNREMSRTPKTGR